MDGGQLFCTLDITQAYANKVIDEESALLQTLSIYTVTLRKPAHIWLSSYSKRLAKVFGPINTGSQQSKMFFDDINIQDSSKEQLLCGLRQVL